MHSRMDEIVAKFTALGAQTGAPTDAPAPTEINVAVGAAKHKDLRELDAFEAHFRKDCGMPDHARFQWDAPYMVAALDGWEASAERSKDIIAFQAQLLDTAINAMESLHKRLVPNDDEAQDATVPAAALREFVDAHANLLYARKNVLQNPEQRRLYLIGERLRKLRHQLEEDGKAGSEAWRAAYVLDGRIGSRQQVDTDVEQAEALLIQYSI